MRSVFVVVSLAAIAVCGCSEPSEAPVAAPAPPPSTPQLAGIPSGDFVIGTPVSHENLTIFPISSKTPRQIDRFITLDEGLAAGTVEILEVGTQEMSANPINSPNAPSRTSQWQTAQLPSDQTQTDHQQPADDDSDDLFGPPDTPANENVHSHAQQDQSTRQVADAQSGSNNDDVSDDLFGPPSEDENPFASTDPDGDVNQLLVLNTSGKPLYLMPGEVISGSKQDRAIGEELVIPSGNAPVPVDVFCVEHGRWGGRSIEHTTTQLAHAADFDSSLSLVTSRSASVAKLAEDARRGRFVASVGHLSKDARLAVQDAAAQDKVWDEVAKTNSKVGNDSDSDNFAANYMSGEVAQDFAPFVKEITPLGESPQIIGVAVAVNGKILSVDTFESTPLFRKFWPKLLKSYALDAVAAQSEQKSDAPLKQITADDCLAFLKDLEQSQLESEKLADGQVTDKRSSPSGISHSYYDAEAAARVNVDTAGGMGGGAFGGGVHTSVLAK